MFNNIALEDLNNQVFENSKEGVDYYYGMGFFQVVKDDGSTFQVCYNMENGKINLSDMGEDWGICGGINSEFKGNILEEVKKYAKIAGIKVYQGG